MKPRAEGTSTPSHAWDNHKHELRARGINSLEEAADAAAQIANDPGSQQWERRDAGRRATAYVDSEGDLVVILNDELDAAARHQEPGSLFPPDESPADYLRRKGFVRAKVPTKGK